MPSGRGGRGRGNPYPFCRLYPWLPRRWWASPYAAQYAAMTPYMGHGYPYYGAGPYGAGAPYRQTKWYPWWQRP